MNLHCSREATQRAQARSRVNHDIHRSDNVNGNLDQMASFRNKINSIAIN